MCRILKRNRSNSFIKTICTVPEKTNIVDEKKEEVKEICNLRAGVLSKVCNAIDDRSKMTQSNTGMQTNQN